MLLPLLSISSQKVSQTLKLIDSASERLAKDVLFDYSIYNMHASFYRDIEYV